MNTQSTKPKNYSSSPAGGKGSLDNMPTNFDRTLSTGSLLRCVCPKCNTPRVVSSGMRSCHSCKSELVIWYRKVGTSSWIEPRKAPKDVSGPYQQCKHFLQRMPCVKYPCKFAHGQDEVEIWDLHRGKSKFAYVKRVIVLVYLALSKPFLNCLVKKCT